MQLREGVDLHFIESDKYTTNRITIRFVAPMSEDTVAGRVLAANLIEMGNQAYPTSQLLRRRLAELYGAVLSTTVSKRGEAHIVDLTVSYVQSAYLPNGRDLTEEMIDLLDLTLYKPLVKKAAFQKDSFDVEKKNLVHFLETEIEDHFYHADVELNKLFFQDTHVQIPKFSRIDLVEKETPQSTYQTFQNMLRLDKIDIFVIGKVKKSSVIQQFQNMAFTYRKPILHLEYKQDFFNIVHEKIERKKTKQSILELAYHLQVLYNDVNYIPLLVLNGLFGGFSHSKLFRVVREREALAYSVGSSINVYAGILKVYAGIDKSDRLKTMKLIARQLLDIKQGKISEEEIILTKKMLIHSNRLAQDRQGTQLEQIYNQITFVDRYITPKDWVELVQKVTKEDIVRVAQLIRLQAVYFMEGVGE